MRYLLVFVLFVSTYASDYKISLMYSCKAGTKAFTDYTYINGNVIPNSNLSNRLDTLRKLTYKNSKSSYNTFEPKIVFHDFPQIKDDSLKYVKNGNNVRLGNSPIYIFGENSYDPQPLLNTSSSRATIKYYKDEKVKYGYNSYSSYTKQIPMQEDITVFLDKEKSLDSYNKCLDTLEKDKREMYMNSVIFTVVSIILLFVGYKLVRFIYTRVLKPAPAKIKAKYNQFKSNRESDRVRKIAEEESIRSSVKKSFEDSEDHEKKDLQDLINKAVARGDSETAQALLKILDNKNSDKNK